MSPITCVLLAVTVFSPGQFGTNRMNSAKAVARARLNVLAPIIGTWRHEQIEDEGASGSGIQIKASWNETGTMIVLNAKTFVVDLQTGRDKNVREYMNEYIVWNHEQQRIECFSANVLTGDLHIYELKASEEAGALTLTYTEIRSVRQRGGSFRRIATLEQRDSWVEWTVELLDRTNEHGNREGDERYTFGKIDWLLDQVPKE